MSEQPGQLVANGRDTATGRFAPGWKGGGRKPGSFDLRRVVREQAEIHNYPIEQRLFDAVRNAIELCASPSTKPVVVASLLRSIALSIGETQVSVTHRETLGELIGIEPNKPKLLAQ